MLRVLIVDDEPTYRVSLTRALTKNGYNVTAAVSGEEGVELLTTSHFDLLITDLKMPGMNGIELISNAKEISPSTSSIIMTAFGSVETAVEAIKLGAFHYILKPFNIEDLLLLANRAIEHAKLLKENIYLKQEASNNNTESIDDIIGNSEAIVSLKENILKYSGDSVPVLLVGETGTGKDFLANVIQRVGSRKNNMFVKIDAAVYTHDKLDIELFGYVKGAFEGANSNKTGKLEIADGGVLYIKNIDKLSLSAQSRINDVVSRGLFEPLGSEKAKAVDIKLIFSTTANLSDLVKRSKFREDLYSRIELGKIEVPSLRDRKEDIMPLLRHFLLKYNKSMKKNIKDIKKNVQEALEDYSWPQNVRELDNIVKRFVILNDKEVKKDSLPKKILGGEDSQSINIDNISIPKVVLPEDGININLVIKTIEEDLIIQALEKTSWNKNQAAKLLELNRTTLVEKLRKKGLLKPKENTNWL